MGWRALKSAIVTVLVFPMYDNALYFKLNAPTYARNWSISYPYNFWRAAFALASVSCPSVLFATRSKVYNRKFPPPQAGSNILKLLSTVTESTSVLIIYFSVKN